MTDMSDTIERLGDWSEFVVTRYKARGTTDGEVDPLRIEETPTIVASIQPASGRDLQRLPEGLRSSEVIVIWTKTLLKVLGSTNSAGATQPADTLVYEGETYQVERCERWVQAGNFYEALARKV